MQSACIVDAKREAQRFLKRVKAYEERYGSDTNFREYCHMVGFKETGALRRASLDLTRALAQMRK